MIPPVAVRSKHCCLPNLVSNAVDSNMVVTESVCRKNYVYSHRRWAPGRIACRETLG